MKLRTLVPLLLASALTAALAGPAPKAPVEELQESFILPGVFDTGVKTSDVYTEGHLTLTVPLWSTLGSGGTLGGSYLFITPYSSLGERGELANSLGLGFRHLFNDQPISAATDTDSVAGFLTEGLYIGANVFVDNLTTQFDNDFWQLGVGAEIGTRYLEVRGNYYIPLDNSKKLAERKTDSRTFTDRRTSSSTRYATTNESNAEVADDLYATGNTIQQDVNMTNISTTTRYTTTSTTTTKTTIKTITSLYEEGMEGWDAEVAVLVPGIDKHLDVTLLAGYYSFDNQPFGPQDGGTGKTEGWKVGVEVRPLPAIVLTGTWYEDEGLTGSDWVVGAGVQIPLGKGWQDAFKSRRRHLIERLAEPVARQNAAIKTSLTYNFDQKVSQKSSTKTQTNAAVVQRTVTQNKESIAIKEDVIFVNNGGAVGNGIEQAGTTQNGTAENPFTTIQQGADLAATNNVATSRIWNVYTQGAGDHGGDNYTESVTIGSGVHFISSANLIVSPLNGATFGTGDRPYLSGGFAGDAASTFIAGYTAPVVSITGYDIVGGYNPLNTLSTIAPAGFAPGDMWSVAIFNVADVQIVDNLLMGEIMGGAYVARDGDVSLIFRDNVVSGPMITGLNVWLPNGNLTADISNNSFTDGATAMNLLTSNGGINAFIDNNSISSYTNAILVEGSGNHSVQISNTLLTDVSTVSYSLVSTAGSVNATILNNNSMATSQGLRINGATGITADVQGNSFNGAGITLNSPVSIVANLLNNDFDGGNAGISLFSIGTIDAYLEGNNVTNTTSGIFMSGQTGVVATLINNYSSGNAQGISISSFGPIDAYLRGNTSVGNFGSGIVMGGSDVTATLINNVSSNNDFVGISISGTGSVSANLRGNTANDNDFDGVSITGLSISGNITNNRASENAGNGFLMQTTGDYTGNITGNFARGNDLSGFNIAVGNSYTGAFNNNTARLNDAYGFETTVLTISGGPFTLNTATGNTLGNFLNNGAPLANP